MQRILNQQEIDALFRAATGGQAIAAQEQKIVACNFHKAGQIAREHVHAVSSLHDAFARHLTYSLGAYLRSTFDVNLVSVEQLTYKEFLQRLPELSYAASVQVQPMNAIALLHMDLALAFPIVDLLLGGRGTPAETMRDITEIEEQILETVLRIICRDLQSHWQPLGFQIALGKRQPQSQLGRIHINSERMLAISFEIRMQEAGGALTFAFPATVSTQFLRKLALQWVNRTQATPSEAASRLRERLLRARYRVDLSLCQLRLPMRELLEIAPGHVLNLPRRIDAPATLLAARVPLFHARAARSGVCKAAQLENAIPTERVAKGQNR